MLLQEWRKTGEKSILMTFVKRKNVTHQNKDFRQRRRRIKYNKWSLNYHFFALNEAKRTTTGRTKNNRG